MLNEEQLLPTYIHIYEPCRNVKAQKRANIPF